MLKTELGFLETGFLCVIVLAVLSFLGIYLEDFILHDRDT